MIEFCKCGSMILNSKCSNKNCDIKPIKSGAETSTKKTKEKKKKTKATSSKSRRSSKCVTYKMSEFLDKEEGNSEITSNESSKVNNSSDDASCEE